MDKMYPAGTKDFKALVSGKYHFVDKTMMIRDICDAEDQTFLYTRPRRFGKTINLSMLDYYFNSKYKDDEDIFKGLKISSCHQCDVHKNAYPVINMDFSDLDSTSSDKFNISLRSMVRSVALQCESILEGKKLSKDDKETINRAKKERTDIVDIRLSISNMCEIIYNHIGKKVIILVDEYDHCIQEIRSQRKFNEIIKEIRPFMEKTFKRNKFIRFAVVTGIMPLAKTSMLSSFNNADVRSILDVQGDEYFGFTESEVIKLLEETDYPADKIDEIREWYDGYHFGNADVYNPYSVMMYLMKGCKPKSYWNNMTGGGMSKELISSLGPEPLIALKSLYENGTTFRSIIDTTIAYPDVIIPYVRPSTVYSYLAMAGYLKTYDTGETSEGKSLCVVSMVNEEVSYAFKALVERADELDNNSVSAVDAFFDMNPDTSKKYVEEMLCGIAMDRTWLEDSYTSIHNRYRDIIMAYLSTPKVHARTEVHKGYGKTDIFFPPANDHRAMIIEVKTTADDDKDLKGLANEAIRQIDRKKYAGEIDSRGSICVGIGIHMKTVEVVFKDE